MTLRDVFENKLGALYDMELMLVDALPTMAEAATDTDLKECFTSHLEETQDQVKRLKKIYKSVNLNPERHESEAIRGLIKDAEWVIANIEEGEARDACLAKAAQCVEHYEMACYMGAIAWADLLEETDISELLSESLDEEEVADESLDEVGEKLDDTLVTS